MSSTPKLFKGKYKEIFQLIFRNVFILINVIIFSVVVLLFYFGDTKEALFLGIIFFLNTLIGTYQDINSWIVLEKLNLMTIMRVIRVNKDKTETQVIPEEIKKNDVIKLKLGDQIPADGVLLVSKGLEVNSALITGESDSFAKLKDDEVLAGSIVTAGAGEYQTATTFQESRISKMTDKIKKYSRKRSPIQESVDIVVKYAGFILIAIIILVLLRARIIHEPAVLVVQNIGALASALVPQGLVIAITLLFAYGATHLLRRHVLLQEMNSVEKLSHVKNLCMDKTGTLTENIPTVEEVLVYPGISREDVDNYTSAYVDFSGDSSETVLAIKKFVNKTSTLLITDSLPFSSTRRFGGVMCDIDKSAHAVLLGAPETFQQNIVIKEERSWLDSIIKTYAPKGKRIVCLVACEGVSLPKDISDHKLTVLAVYVLQHNVREGVKEAVKFFQDRGVRIRIISGDNPETVHAISHIVGINNPDSVVTGAEIESWTSADFESKVSGFSIFARIKPEQKEKIIEALKKNGFTAMIGDGANDALAIKTADLGIAMFDGAPATRKLAGVVLTHNSFSELPDGVRLADSIIENIELYSSLFFNQTFLAFLLLCISAILGFSYPFTPLNITFINYFTIGIPSFLIFYWTIRPQKIASPIRVGSYLKRVLYFPFISAVFQSLIIFAVYKLSISYFVSSEINSALVLAFIMTGYIFFVFAPGVYSGVLNKLQKVQFFGLAVTETVLIFIAFKIPFVMFFFSISVPKFVEVMSIAVVCIVVGIGQYVVTRFFIRKPVLT